MHNDTVVRFRKKDEVVDPLVELLRNGAHELIGRAVEEELLEGVGGCVGEGDEDFAGQHHGVPRAAGAGGLADLFGMARGECDQGAKGAGLDVGSFWYFSMALSKS